MSYYPKPAILLCSIFSNSGHVGWCTASPETILKLDTLVMIQTKFGFHWSCTFRGEDFWKRLRRTTDDDDGCQVMAIAHMTLWVRWAKNDISITVTFLMCLVIFSSAIIHKWNLFLKYYEQLVKFVSKAKCILSLWSVQVSCFGIFRKKMNWDRRRQFN